MSSRRLNELGWLMFAVSGVFFLVPAIRDVDWWSLGAAAAWLLGVLFFWVDLRRNPQQ